MIMDIELRIASLCVRNDDQTSTYVTLIEN